MKKILELLFIISVILLFNACSFTKQVRGEYYLQEKEYDKGYKHFQKRVNQNDNDALSQFYYGRFLLAKKKNKEALSSLKKAVYFDNTKADYYSWLGVAYSTQKQYKNERTQYLKALKIDKSHLQSLTYLSHNYYEKKDYKKAFTYYGKVIEISPGHKISLYNRAMSLHKLKRISEEKTAWLAYLQYYPSGVLARKAVHHLNYLGNFEYQNHLIGFHKIILKNITFEPFTSKIDSKSKSSLALLGKVLSKNKKIKIHIIAYQKQNKVLAKQRAKSVKEYILYKYPIIDSGRLKLSWFNQSKNVKIKKRKHTLNELIDFITVIEKNK